MPPFFRLLLGLIVLLLIISVAIRLLKRNSLPSLVLDKFEIFESGNSDGIYLHFTGRRAGIFAWILTVLRLEVQWTFSVTKSLLMIQGSDLNGSNNSSIPLGKIGIVQSGHKKPTILLGVFSFIAFCCFVLPTIYPIMMYIYGVSAWTIRGLAIAIFLLGFALYIVNKTMYFNVIVESQVRGARFRPGVLKGVTLKIDKVTKAMNLLVELIDRASATESHMIQNGQIDLTTNSSDSSYPQEPVTPKNQLNKLEKCWHIQLPNGEKIEPMNIQEFRATLSSKQLSPNALVAKNGWSSWKTLSTLTEDDLSL